MTHGLIFLVATAQGLNASKSGLVEVPFNFFAEGEMKQKLNVHQRAFLKYQFQHLTTQEEGLPPTVPVVASPHELAAATGQASRSRTLRSVSYTPTTQGGAPTNLRQGLYASQVPGLLVPVVPLRHRIGQRLQNHEFDRHLSRPLPQVSCYQHPQRFHLRMV